MARAKGSGLSVMVRRVALALFILLLVVTVFATLSPIGLRPKTGHLIFERTAPFIALGLSLALAAPRRVVLVLLIVVFIAVSSEYCQVFSPSRHSELNDAYEKAFGALLGVLAVEVGRDVLERVRRGFGLQKAQTPEATKS